MPGSLVYSCGRELKELTRKESVEQRVDPSRGDSLCKGSVVRDSGGHKS